MKMRSTLCALLLCATGVTAQKTPTGTEVLRRMHDAYAGKWYKTLTFRQTTTQYPQTGEPRIATWVESLRQDDARGTLLRIDLGDPALGNVALYSADSTWVVRGGKLVRTAGHGNEFLPLIEGVYMQPVDKTAAQLRAMAFNIDRVADGNWEGRPVWIVGATSPTDSTSSQFSVDKERNIVLHAKLAQNPNTPPLDIRLDNYVQLAGGWLATKISMTIGGRPVQMEEYADWQANIDVPAKLFDASQ